jgi:hypothetical protein
MRCAKVGVLYPFLATHRPFLATRRAFLAMLSLVSTTSRQSRGRSVPFPATLHAFAVTRSEGEDGIHEESCGHHALH